MTTRKENTFHRSWSHRQKEANRPKKDEKRKEGREKQKRSWTPADEATKNDDKTPNERPFSSSLKACRRGCSFTPSSFLLCLFVLVLLVVSFVLWSYPLFYLVPCRFRWPRRRPLRPLPCPACPRRCFVVISCTHTPPSHPSPSACHPNRTCSFLCAEGRERDKSDQGDAIIGEMRSSQGHTFNCHVLHSHHVAGMPPTT
jgi:hypothetical protein